MKLNTNYQRRTTMAKKKTLGEKIQQQLDKLAALHEKEENIIDKITDIIDEEEGNDAWDDEGSYGGTDPD
jgi:hypothetical protein